jgi:hypothetical protein
MDIVLRTVVIQTVRTLQINVCLKYNYKKKVIYWIVLRKVETFTIILNNFSKSGGELLELRLLDTHLLNTFGSKSIARHKFCHLLESS